MRLAVSLGSVLLVLASGRWTPAAEIDFAHDVLPVLKAHCAECHTDGTYKGSFSIDTRDSLLDSGAVEPGNAAASDLIDRLTSDDPEYRMPPEGPRLTEAEVAALKNWIDAKVPWTDGFSFRKPQYSAPLELKTVAIPEATPETGEHPIDRLLGAYATAHEVQFPAAADDAAFLRRASLDLIGLLPTTAELEAFTGDSDPDKRTKTVDALLARDHDYATHWLTFWNDLLRNDFVGPGYIDGGRKQITGWLYLALLNNKPYDDFVRELIAPGPESEGFANGIIWRGRVSASQVRELQFSQNVGQVFLGINLKCASCHDSFIDDWKLTDAYGLAAVIADAPLEMHRCDVPTGKTAEAKFVFPELGEIDGSLPRPERQARLASLMTDPKNGRLPRTIVNRVWKQLMGRGLVEPVDSMAAEPWSEDLLDHLSGELVAKGYDLKELMRHIATSRAYQLRTVAVDTEPMSVEGYVFRGPQVRRLSAEQFVDALWSMTGIGPAAPHTSFTLPAEPRVDASRLKVRAALVPSDSVMNSLGRPNREQVVTTRPDQMTTLEALDLANGPAFAELLENGAVRLNEKYAGQSSEALVDDLYVQALSRQPTDSERVLALEIVGSPATPEGLADLLWTILMLPEFQHVQ